MAAASGENIMGGFMHLNFLVVTPKSKKQQIQLILVTSP